MSNIEILICKDLSLIENIVKKKIEKFIRINFPISKAIKIQELKNLDQTVNLEQTHSLYPNFLFNGIFYYLQKYHSTTLIVGTNGLSYSSIIEIIDFFRFKSNGEYNLIFVMNSDKLSISYKFITIKNDTQIDSLLGGDHVFENFIKSFN